MSTAVYIIFTIVLAVGVAGALRALWPTRAERAYGYPHDSVESRMLRGER